MVTTIKLLLLILKLYRNGKYINSCFKLRVVNVRLNRTLDSRFCLACFIIASFAAAGVKMGICGAVGFNAINEPAA